MSNVMNLTARLSQLGKELVDAQHKLLDAQTQFDMLHEEDEDDAMGLANDAQSLIYDFEDQISDIQDEIADCEEELDELSNQHTATGEENW